MRSLPTILDEPQCLAAIMFFRQMPWTSRAGRFLDILLAEVEGFNFLDSYAPLHEQIDKPINLNGRYLHEQFGKIFPGSQPYPSRAGRILRAHDIIASPSSCLYDVKE